jgi:hypothetical protein
MSDTTVIESQACCDATAKTPTITTSCSDPTSGKAYLDQALSSLKVAYAVLSANVCATNQACKTSYTHDADARSFICGGDKKPWEIATWVLAGVLALFLLVAFMRA